MELEYEQVGDYLIPKLEMAKQIDEPLTKYGILRKNYLRERWYATFSAKLMAGELEPHCLEIQNRAKERMAVLVKQMAEEENVTEKLKSEDMMLWVQKINNIQARAEEIVLNEIVYVLY